MPEFDLSRLDAQGAAAAREGVLSALAWLDNTPGAKRDRADAEYAALIEAEQRAYPMRMVQVAQAEEVAGQMALDDTPPIPRRVLSFRAHARTTDPDTSHEAAASVIDPNKGTYARILRLMRVYSDGLTDDELFAVWSEARDADYPPISPSGLRSRRHELTVRGLIVWSGEYDTSGTRRRRIWKAAVIYTWNEAPDTGACRDATHHGWEVIGWPTTNLEDCMVMAICRSSEMAETVTKILNEDAVHVCGQEALPL